MENDKIFNYTIVMKNGTKYNVNSNLLINELIKMILPKFKDDTEITCFSIADIIGKMVAIIGSEVSSIEYTVN